MNFEKLAELAFAILFAIVLQPATAGAESSENLTKISLDDLPQPPAEIQALLESANVSFQTGSRHEAPTEPVDQPGRKPRRLAGETKYTIDYSYKNRCRWRTRETAGKRELVITVRYGGVSFQGSHAVWLRKPPSSEWFWEDKLVLHELDHVKISSDPALANRFTELLKENSVLKRTVEPGAVVNEALVNRLIDEHVKELFDQVSQLIAIRYQELDRVTSHGTRPLPADSPLNEFLRPPEGDKAKSE